LVELTYEGLGFYTLFHYRLAFYQSNPLFCLIINISKNGYVQTNLIESLYDNPFTQDFASFHIKGYIIVFFLLFSESMFCAK